MQLLLIFVLTMLTVNVCSQPKSSNEIVVEGAAKMKVKPDIATLTLTMEKNDSIEKDAIRNLNIGIQQLVNTLNNAGFTNEAIKISGYDIMSSTDDKNKKIYTASNRLKVEFRIDNKLIDAFYREIQQAGTQDLEVSLDTQVSDDLEKTTRLTLVRLAIEDAKTNAKNISKNLAVELIRIKQVHKSNERVLDMNKVEMKKFTPPRIVRDSDYDTSFSKLQVEDFPLEEKITIVYEISNQSYGRRKQ